MNYHQRKNEAFWRTCMFVTMLSLTILVTAILISALITATYYFYIGSEFSTKGQIPQEAVGFFAKSLCAITISMLFMAVVKISSMKSLGGSMIARQLAGKPLPDNAKTHKQKQLRNIVEEMSIASGIPVPEVYIIEDEESINAFVAGFTPSDAVIAVTSGALIHLNRSELQAVIGHEFSHILNGDMQLNSNMIAWQSVIMQVYNFGSYLVYMVKNGRKKNSAALFAYAFLIIGMIGLFFAKQLKSVINREREYLADISAMRLTRDSSGMIGALMKIACHNKKASSKNPAADIYAHMMFTSTAAIQTKSMTHPSIISRIKKIDPHFNIQELNDMRRHWNRKKNREIKEHNRHASIQPQSALIAGILGSATSSFDFNYSKPTADNLAASKKILENIPEKIKFAARNQFSAEPLLYSLLINTDDIIKLGKQMREIRIEHGDKMTIIIRKYSNDIKNLDMIYYLPIAELSFSSISKISTEQKRKMIATINKIIAVDSEIGIFKYCLTHTLKQHLTNLINPSSAKTDGNRKLTDMMNSVQTLITVLSQLNSNEENQCKAYYDAGMSYAFTTPYPEYIATRQSPGALNKVWNDLESLSHDEKIRLLVCMLMTIEHDGIISNEEYVLVSTICSSINLPMPAITPNQDIDA